MTVEQTIEQILSKNPEVSRKEILERLERERRRMGGFVSDETLLRMIAAEFGLEYLRNEALALTLSVKDLISGLNDVVVVGRVVAFFTPKTFRGIRSGKFASLLVADQSGILRVVLWNDKAGLVETGDVKVGEIIRFSHGYTREGRGERVELHIGEKGEVEINPKDVEEKAFPTVNRFATRIGEIEQAHRSRRVNVIGVVKEMFSASTFQRQDLGDGKVMRFTLVDETGEICVVVWNEKVDEIEKTLKKGSKLQIVSAGVKKASNEGLEIHVDAGTYMEALVSEGEFLKIADLREGLGCVNVEGEVVSKPVLRDVKTSKGELVRLAVFELKDGTGRVWVSAWRKHVDSVRDLRIGDSVMIKNGYVRRGFGDQLEVSTKTTTSIILPSKNCDARSH